MVRRETQELSLTRARFPLWDLLPILEFGIQNIAGAAKHLGSAKIGTTSLDAAEKFNGCKAIDFRCMVVDPGCIAQGKGPEPGVVFLRPMDLDMEEHGAGTVGHHSNGTFRHGVLVVRSST
jgi:hypothetical protein